LTAPANTLFKMTDHLPHRTQAIVEQIVGIRAIALRDRAKSVQILDGRAACGLGKHHRERGGGIESIGGLLCSKMNFVRVVQLMREENVSNF